MFWYEIVCMNNTLTNISTDIRRLAADLSIGTAKKAESREFIIDLCLIEQKLQRGLSDLEMQTSLWHLWIVLEEVVDKQEKWIPTRRDSILRLIQKIQANAFRLSQRWSIVSTLKKPNRSSPYERSVAFIGNEIGLGGMVEKRKAS
jgi:hypothetical protein